MLWGKDIAPDELQVVGCWLYMPIGWSNWLTKQAAGDLLASDILSDVDNKLLASILEYSKQAVEKQIYNWPPISGTSTFPDLDI